MIFVMLNIILTLRGEGMALILVHVKNFLERLLPKIYVMLRGGEGGFRLSVKMTLSITNIICERPLNMFNIIMYMYSGTKHRA